MILAAIDLGSNTLRLLVAETNSNRIQEVITKELLSPRLGIGLKANFNLDVRAMAEAEYGIYYFNKLAHRLGAKRVVLGATQACRVAINGADFILYLTRKLLLDRAWILSSIEEAQLSRLGVMNVITGPLHDVFIADVGGGSVELVNLGGGDIKVISIPIGSLMLTENYLHHDPPTTREIAALMTAIDTSLKVMQGIKVRRLVVTAGTVSSLASYVLGLGSYNAKKINNLLISRVIIMQAISKLVALPLVKRKEIIGLRSDSARVDILIAGIAILEGLLKLFSLDELTAMDAGLLEGLLLDDLYKLGK